MVRLKVWQWFILATLILSMLTFLMVAAGLQIHRWGINWIWGLFVLSLVLWRWLLVKWTKPVAAKVEALMLRASQELNQIGEAASAPDSGNQEEKLEGILRQACEISREDPPLWEDWPCFWQRCQDLVVKIAQVYHPEVKYPLLNIYVPQAYGLIRGTVDDLDRWIAQLSPALNQITIAQAYRGYELYRQLEPSARRLVRIWDYSQWLFNPALAAAKFASQGASQEANQQLLVNLSQLLREAALRNLARQAITLYSGNTLPADKFAPAQPTLPQAKTKTLEEILTQARPPEAIEQEPINILLAGRTGAGKSSLIDTLFDAQTAAVDVLPSTAAIGSYQWQAPGGERLTLWDTPGYEQVKGRDYRQLVLDCAPRADILLLVTPALDPALQMDLDFLTESKIQKEEKPILAVVTKVDRLRPVREWQPPYNWQTGKLPKEISIREAVEYRSGALAGRCTQVLPLVCRAPDPEKGRPWNEGALALAILDAIAPAKQLRLARFFRNLEARSLAAAKIIDRHTFQMATSKGLAELLKSPVLAFLATLTAGSPRLAYLLAERIPLEQLPVVIGKLQLAHDLFSLLSGDGGREIKFDLLSLWNLAIESSAPPEQEAWAFGHALVEYWTKDLDAGELRSRYQHFLQLL